MELEEEIREFVIECNEYMEVLDRDILLLEEDPGDADLIASVFRAVHTIKGTCGFFGFDLLGSLTHVVETILGQIRERERALTPQLVSLILESLDIMRALLRNIESSGVEGPDSTAELQARLEDAAKMQPRVVPPAEEKLQLPDPPQAAPAGSLDGTPPPATVIPDPTVPISSPAMAAIGGDEDATSQTQREANKEAQLAESTIRVDVALLNRLMNLVGELVLARNQLLQDTSSQNTALQQTSQRLNLITSELQEGVMKTRMQPIGVVWNKLPRIVRDLAAKCGKLVRIEMDGAGTELDKTIIEAIKDPLTHIVRNSCDHGIEEPDVRHAKGKLREGLLLLRAYHEGGVVNIEISDDGAGIDPQRVKNKAVEKGLIRPEQAVSMSDREATLLIFLPGFSTATQISTVSGRGVGMDVVKTNIEKIGGGVELLNRADVGTTIRIKIPLTLAIIPGLVVALRRDVEASALHAEDQTRERFIIPQANLLELVRVEAAEMKKRVENVHGTPVFHHRGRLLPLIYLGRILQVAQQPQDTEAISIVVLQAESTQFGLVVDGISDTQEIVVKPLGRQLKGLSCYVGATIMGDGRPALILDVAGLARLAQLNAQGRSTAVHGTSSVSTRSRVDPQMLLLFRVGSYERMAVPLALVDRLEEVRLSEVEHSGGRPVLHYRGEILPLLSVDSMKTETRAIHEVDPTLQIIVFTNGQQRAGLVVDRILDIVNEAITCRRLTSAPPLLGSAVVGGKITDLLDLSSLLASTGENWLGVSDIKCNGQERPLLLIDSAPFSREILRGWLMMSGYEVVCAANVNDALVRAREQNGVAAILLNTHGEEIHKEEFAHAVRLDQMFARTPIVELGNEVGGRGEDIVQLQRTAISGLLETLPKIVAGRPSTEAVWQ